MIDLQSLQVGRLMRRRDELLVTGAYSAQDPLLMRIQDRVEELLVKGKTQARHLCRDGEDVHR